MKGLLVFFTSILILTGCGEREFNQELANELEQMAIADKTAAKLPANYAELDQEGWQKWKDRQDSVVRVNKTRLEEIFNEYGFPGYDLVGEEGERDFMRLVLQSSFDPEFQQRVLEKQKNEVEGQNADQLTFAQLTDQVKLNLGEKQVYGTYVIYDSITGQAIPKPIEDSLKVNARREALGLQPIEVHLNALTKNYFKLNKEKMESKGILEPKLYEVEEPK